MTDCLVEQDSLAAVGSRRDCSRNRTYCQNVTAGSFQEPGPSRVPHSGADLVSLGGILVEDTVLGLEC